MKKSNKNVFLKFLSLILAMAMCMANMVPAFAQTDSEMQYHDSFDSGNPLIVASKTASGSLNLTDLGTLDWMHVTGEEVNQKKDTEHFIAMENLSEDSISTLSDSPVQYSWTDGDPQEEVTGCQKGGVFNYKAGDTDSVNKDITENAGYKLSIPAADYAQQLVFASGIWQAQAEISVAVNGDNQPVYETTLQATNSANVQIYTLSVRSGYSVDVTCKLKKKTNEWGNLSLGGIALSKLAPPVPVSVEVTDAPNAVNLTEKGDVDWVHPVGTADTTDRKNIAEPIIQIKNRDEASNSSTMSDSPVVYSWTDGTPTQAAGGNTRGAVYNYKPGDDSSVNVDIQDEAGYEITVPAADYSRQVSFVSGIWMADAEISIYLNGSDTPTYENNALSAESGSAVVKMYAVHANSGDSIKIVCQLKKKTHSYGNISLGCVALGKVKADDSDYRAKTEALLQDAKDLDTTDCSELLKSQLENEITYSEAVLNEPSSNSDDYYAAYYFLKQAYDAADAACMDGNGKYMYQSNSGLVSSFGWEGDINAPIAYLDGSYRLRSFNNTTVTFGVTDIPGKVKWYNAEGYLPCFISEYSKNDMDYKVENFSDLVEVDGNKFEIAYSRMTITNNSTVTKLLPVVSSQLVPLNNSAKTATKVESGKTVERDYAIPADRFGESYDWPSAEKLAGLGGFDDHYTHMKKYWNDRLEPLAVIKDLPDQDLINAYKAGFIYTLIIRDDVKQSDGSTVKELHVGENGYDEMFDHDTIGIVSTLLTIGDYTNAKEYLTSLPAQLQYDDAKWKYSWPYALYLRKTGDINFVRQRFDVIKTNTHKIETDRINNGKGIMKTTNAIDSNGYWTIDNWSALMGLTTYRYICDQLGETAEAQWAKAEYDDLYQVVTDQLQKTMTKYNLDYIPISMVEPNETGPRKDPRDANWVSMFLFGRWGWDGYLFGAEQSGLMLDKIDDTYTHGFERRASITDNPYNFGGYPHGYFSSAYNAGYGSTALRGEEYRDAGIKAYQFMIDKAMSGPFGWWEGVGYPSDSSPWDIDHASTGGGSCQHMWGQSTATKVLFDSLIAEKTDDTVIIGRGIPTEWLTDGKKVEIANYPVKNNNRIGYKMTTTGTAVSIEFTGDVSKVPFSIELMGLKDNIQSADGLSFNQEKGTVAIPAGTQKVTIVMKNACVDNTALNNAVLQLKQSVKTAQSYSSDAYTHMSYFSLKNALDNATKLLANDSKTVEQVQSATDKIEHAIKSLVLIDIIDTIDFTNGDAKSGYSFGMASDQYKRYQTFFAPETGKVNKVEVKVYEVGSVDELTDMTADVYTLKDDNKSLDKLISSATVKKANVNTAGQATVIPMNFELSEGKSYALVLGQTAARNTSYYTWQVMSNDNNQISYIKWNKETDGSDKFVDESSLGKGWMKIAISKYSKESLQELIENAEKLNSVDYTSVSWANLLAVLGTASGVLQKSNDPAEVMAAEKDVSNAVLALVKNQADQTVSSFEELNLSVKTQNVANGTPLVSLNLPSSLKVTINGEEETIHGITWPSSPIYMSNAAGTYTFTAKLPSGYVLANGTNVPAITVVVAKKANDNSHHNSSTESSKGNETSSSIVTVTTNEKGSSVATVTTKPDAAPVVTGSRSAVSVTVPADAASVIASATKEKPAEIKISAPANEIRQELTNSAIQSVDLNMKVPDSVANNTNANAKVTINADSSVLQAAKDTQKDITLSVTNSDTGKEIYSWTFFGKSLRNSVASVTNVNFALNVGLVKNDTVASTVVAKNTTEQKASGVLLKFNNNGLLPAEAKVKVYVGDQEGCTPNSKIFLYYLNQTTNALEQMLRSEYTVDSNGYVTITISHCSDYVLLPKSATSPYPVKSDTSFPVGVKNGKTYTFAMTVSGNATPSFTIGNGKAFTSLVKRVNSRYYVTVRGGGAVGTMTAVYCTLPGQKPIVMDYIAVSK